MNEFLDRIVRELVDAPEKVTIETRDDGRTCTFIVKVAAEDVGKLVGKRGRTAQSIRVLLAAIAGKQEKRAQLEILES
jgi:uncharacterized protein